MAVEWFYQVGGFETGPVTSQQLKKLAGDGIVIPSTPLRRKSGGEVSPWTRAGAVQGMFTGDVIDQLGEPICDDCGRRLQKGKCLVCSIADPPPFVNPTPSELAEAPATVHPPRAPIAISRKYPNLRSYVGVIKFMAVLQLIVWCLISCFCVVQGIAGSGLDGASHPVLGIVCGGVALLIGLGAYTILMALAELFLVFIDTEENTRRTSAIVEQL